MSVCFHKHLMSILSRRVLCDFSLGFHNTGKLLKLLQNEFLLFYSLLQLGNK